MGYEDRRTRRLVSLMAKSKWWRRVRVYLAFLDTPRVPWRLRGTQGVRWLVNGRVPKRRYGHQRHASHGR